ncbi:MAG: hypothetical protein WA964_16010 [Ilumatobacter sp.]|uniref:hypothetical protein n=1 Tax=Ilumatobacter sp. TaxID=1967498 RepID=UPI003C730562
MIRRSISFALAGIALVAVAACGSDAESAGTETGSSAPLSTENTDSEFCTTFAALDSSSVFLHAGEDAIRPGLELQIEQMEQLRTTLPPELSGVESAIDARLEATRATLDIYAANDFDADAVSNDPTYGDVSDTIGASLQADVVNGTRDARQYCGIEL